METRVTKLETHVECIRRDLDEILGDIREHRKETKSDFRLLFGALITVSLGLAGLMVGLSGLIAKGFGWL
ncbi:hypothetical protein HX882_19190 [Pseudomonas gingeri]|uniref:Uncharacterized protein n=1 Tax=Pseudomonas gingeri TaxID=117681 RepID=A0A7Y8C477_9PSED|nr:hypothetical protein [Pseudomonas gingeri]NWB98026.1 hypothetical protein [Pseudomonas gingeri]